MKTIIYSLLILLIVTSCTYQPVEHNDKVIEKAILANIKNPIIPEYTVSILDFGAKGDSLTNCKPFIEQAIHTVNKKGGGIIKFPVGNYLNNGPIHLLSNIELRLEKGARIFFGSNPADYLPVVKTSWEGTFLYNYSPFIYAHKCKNIAITGEGIIDGEGSSWSEWKANQTNDQLLSREMNHKKTPVEDRIFGKGHFLRPHLIQFFDCKNVKVEGIKIEDSPFWCVHLLCCENVIVRQISFDAQNKNNDGIDPEYSRNVLIEEVHFNNADDNIAIKAGRDDEGRASTLQSENILVRNCYFKGLHALVIGSEMSAGVHNICVRDCNFDGNLKRGIYLKSNPDRGGFIRNVFVKNIQFGEVEDCIYITSYYHNEGVGHQTDISNIYFENVKCALASGTGIVIQGFPEKKIRDIFFKEIEIKAAKNALCLTNSENIIMSNVIIGELASVPSAVH